jgi:SpoVK/Ycf46/Vps4 family AAA+-type ATPase
MQTVKNSIVEQIQFIISNDTNTDGHFLNCTLQGPPGCGKTSLAKILYNIWTSLNIFQSSETEFTILNRADFVGSYMGTTANKTKKKLEKHSGGVIFIDEAYSLSTGDRDDYGKECLDVINAFLSEEKGKTVMIIAGYKKDLNDHFFSQNPGLKRRFNWTFDIPSYTSDELFQIFKHQLNQYNWTCEDSCKSLFHTHYKSFKHFGGDTENVAFKAKIEYSKRNWKYKKKNKRLTYADVEKAIELHFEKEENVINNMYI